MANLEIFDKIADSYETETRLNIFNLCVEEINKLEVSGRLLDFGCGTGNLGISLKDKFDAVCLLDPAPKMQEIIIDKIDQYQLYNCYISNIDLERDTDFNAKFDCIVVAQVLLHIPGYQQLLKKLSKLLTANGQIIIFDYHKNNEASSDIVHNGFDVNELSELFTNQGLVVDLNKTIYKADNALLGKYGELFMLTAHN